MLSSSCSATVASRRGIGARASGGRAGGRVKGRTAGAVLLMSDSKLSVSSGVDAAAAIAISVELLMINDDGSLIVPITMTRRLLGYAVEMPGVAESIDYVEAVVVDDSLGWANGHSTTSATKQVLLGTAAVGH